MARSEMTAKAQKWETCHTVINLARKATGKPLSRNKNPYLDKPLNVSNKLKEVCK